MDLVLMLVSRSLQEAWWPGLLAALVTAPTCFRKSSIIVAADESTISWGPSPTFGELVSGGPVWQGAGPSPGSLGLPPENGQKEDGHLHARL